MKEALFFKVGDNHEVHCFLCNHFCRIADGQLGFCQVRKNVGGRLFSLNYSQLAAANVDPVEKKPLYHFLPGSRSYSIACRGCNFKCEFCQNWQISQVNEAQTLGVSKVSLSSRQVVEQAVNTGCLSIAYTYTEPTIYFEYAYDCCCLSRENGLKNVFVTNGYMSKQALEFIAPYLDAANVDLKAFNQDFYRQVCKAQLKPVCDNIILMKKLGIWVEVTTLIVPGLNDEDNQLRQLAKFIVSVDKNIPWHISGYHPDYKFTKSPATSLQILEKAYDLGKSAGLNYVYIGNVVSSRGQDTLCPNCAKSVIQRQGFTITNNQIKHNRCGFCDEAIAGIWL